MPFHQNPAYSAVDITDWSMFLTTSNKVYWDGTCVCVFREKEKKPRKSAHYQFLGVAKFHLLCYFVKDYNNDARAKEIRDGFKNITRRSLAVLKIYYCSRLKKGHWRYIIAVYCTYITQVNYICFIIAGSCYTFSVNLSW